MSVMQRSLGFETTLLWIKLICVAFLFLTVYARPPAVFRQPVSSVSSQSPPHTLSFPPAAVLSAPMQTVPFSLPGKQSYSLCL